MTNNLFYDLPRITQLHHYNLCFYFIFSRQHAFRRRRSKFCAQHKQLKQTNEPIKTNKQNDRIIPRDSDFVEDHNTLCFKKLAPIFF